MTLKDLVDKAQSAGLLVQNSGGDMAKVTIKFSVDDRSEGTTIEVDEIDGIMYDLMNPSQITINLS